MSLSQRISLVPAMLCLTALIQVSFAEGNDPNEIAARFDLRDSGIMTLVKHQLECGSCGEFAAIGLFEALIKRETGDEVDLSEQQIMDCVPGCGCGVGCSSLQVLEYLREHGVCLEASIPYLDRNDTCVSTAEEGYCISEVHSTTINSLSLQDRIQLIKKTILAHGPVATNMRYFQDLDAYRSGGYAYDGKSQEMGGHWVLLVGWDDSPDSTGKGYWICRNSWGDKWGEDGYFNSAYGDVTGIDDFYIVYGVYMADATD